MKLSAALHALSLFAFSVVACNAASASDIAQTHAEVECLCTRGDSLYRAARRLYGDGSRYKELIAVHPDTGAVIRTATRSDYRSLPLRTRVFAPRTSPAATYEYNSGGRSIARICANYPDIIRACIDDLTSYNAYPRTLEEVVKPRTTLRVPVTYPTQTNNAPDPDTRIRQLENQIRQYANRLPPPHAWDWISVLMIVLLIAACIYLANGWRQALPEERRYSFRRSRITPTTEGPIRQEDRADEMSSAETYERRVRRDVTGPGGETHHEERVSSDAEGDAEITRRTTVKRDPP